MNDLATAVATSEDQLLASWETVCSKEDLVEYSGVAALIGNTQVGIFYLPSQEQQVFAISNYDPFSDANVLARGIVGDLNGELCVASPIYKQHFSLTSGVCLEDESKSVAVWPCKLEGDEVQVLIKK